MGRTIYLLCSVACFVAALGLPTKASAGALTVSHYRWRNDDGSETTATWKAAEDTAITDVEKNENIRLRFSVAADGASYENRTYSLQYSTSRDGSYTTLPVNATTEAFEMCSTENYTNGQATTKQIDLEAFSYHAGACVENPSNSYGNYTLASDYFTNFEFCINATSNAVDGQTYYFKVYVPQGITVILNPQLTIAEGDIAAPNFSSITPADNSEEVALGSNLIMKFSENIGKTGVGNLTIYDASDDSTVEQINVATGAVTGSGTNTITVNPTSDFEEDTYYYIKIDATAFPDENGNAYAGISDSTTWSFTTADHVEPAISFPTLSSMIPPDDVTGVAIDSNLILKFSENIGKTGVGNLTIYDASDDSTVEQINVATGTVTGSGTDTITVNPTSDFDASTTYYIHIDSTAFPDVDENDYAGISDSTTWSFTTAE